MTNLDTCRCLICLDADSRERLDAIDTDTVKNVRDKGVHVVMILEDHETAGWAFTTGLWHTYRSPEVAIFGLPNDIAHRCLQAAADQAAAGRPMAANEERDEILKSLAVALRPVDESWRRKLFGVNVSFYRNTSPAVPFLQMLWPDREGRFPGQQGFATEYEDLQPHLWLSSAQHPAGLWTTL
ncbi:DUF4262 domain-containing protein [Amycolatopsis umgeniensis]|uniref:DUF4262 domain-containing protein n=1 Tax=Amycolatopsis umgeniensis TaxID=336628 RepID=A0A841BCH4_9PSEU|nr:DUF4262 domain-containing protein [Amycolatopsis umgeniensis]MBB5856408.1 hypothetical protein [Amycolatopsis umgeniensis]